MKNGPAIQSRVLVPTVRFVAVDHSVGSEILASPAFPASCMKVQQIGSTDFFKRPCRQIKLQLQLIATRASCDHSNIVRGASTLIRLPDEVLGWCTSSCVVEGSESSSNTLYALQFSLSESSLSGCANSCKSLPEHIACRCNQGCFI